MLVRNSKILTVNCKMIFLSFLLLGGIYTIRNHNISMVAVAADLFLYNLSFAKTCYEEFKISEPLLEWHVLMLQSI